MKIIKKSNFFQLSKKLEQVELIHSSKKKGFYPGKQKIPKVYRKEYYFRRKESKMYEVSGKIQPAGTSRGTY